MKLFPIRDYLSIIKQLLTPKEIHESVLDIDLHALFNQGYSTVFLDIDNTILPVSQKQLSLKFQNWVEKVKEVGFNVFILSNNSSFNRVSKVCLSTQTTGLFFACKPLPFSIKDIAKKHHINLKKSIVVGDQLLTDVLLGNWVRAYPVLVDPLDKKLSFIKTLQREVELRLLKKL